MTPTTQPDSQRSNSPDGLVRPGLDRRRLLGWGSVLGVGIAASQAGFGAARSATAQHAEQHSDPSMPPGSNGITPAPLGSGLPAVAPGYAMGLIRLTFVPGATLNAHTHPGASILYIESGPLIYTLWEGTATVIRAATGPATPGAAPAAETLSPGEITLNVGDSLFEDADVIHTARNNGDEDAVVLIANLLRADEPVTTFLEATPES